MKHLITSIAALLLCYSSLAQDKLFVALDTRECVKCTSYLNRLNDFPADIKKTIVFRTAERRDSLELLQDLEIEDMRLNVLFNDDLFDQFMSKNTMMHSSVSYFKEGSTEGVSTTIDNIESILDDVLKIVIPNAE